MIESIVTQLGYALRLGTFPLGGTLCPSKIWAGYAIYGIPSKNYDSPRSPAAPLEARAVMKDPRPGTVTKEPPRSANQTGIPLRQIDGPGR